MTLRYSTDIVIFGGGVAGLWLLNRLHSEGYQPLLIETKALGSGQTLASQGIIHGGLKYARSGSLTGAANVIAGMPRRWRHCLTGDGDVDLQGVPVLSNYYYMWSDGNLRSRLKTFFGSKSLVGRVEGVKRDDYPEFFSGINIDGSLYRLPDFVIDTAALLEKLAEPVWPRIFQIDENNIDFSKNDSSNYSVCIQLDESRIDISAAQIIFCAGEGNAALIEQTAIQTIDTQVRPLHMVYMKKQNLPRMFVHYVGDDFSLTPKVTITSHQDKQGQTVWYMGGDLAEEGVGKAKEEQIEIAQELVRRLFPWIDTSDGEWNSFVINRAEANINNNYRPDDAFIATESNIMVAWPTKLTLTPSLADKVLDTLQSKSVSAADSGEAQSMLADVAKVAETANAYWD